MSHGYPAIDLRGCKFFIILCAAWARHDSIECPSHGLSISEQEEELATTIFTAQGLPLQGGSFDRSGLGSKQRRTVDSGADGPPTLHTRDIVRHVLDHLTLSDSLRVSTGSDAGTLTLMVTA